MILSNRHYGKLQASYLFTEIAKHVRTYEMTHPDRPVIKLGIGDVTRPLTPSVVRALHDAADEMAGSDGFHGYGPEQGYDFLREAIVARDFVRRNIPITAEEIFVSDGSKGDTGNFQEIFSEDIVVAVPDPVYPVYVDTNVMAGRTGAWRNGHYDGLVYMEGTRANGFVPAPPSRPVDLLYLCFPNNPTGSTATKDQLKTFVDYALEHQALILFDAAYVEFIRDPEIPRSIYEIPGADECAVEFRSFSKTAGFTGMRCAYTVVPDKVEIASAEAVGRKVPLRNLWMRRHTTKFNGASYPIQKAAAAVYAADSEIRELSDYYLHNASLIRGHMESLGYTCTGGDNSPYVWIETGSSSWDFFDRLLEESGVVVTPGAGFGPAGEGYIRISAFNDTEKVEEALERITLDAPA